MDNNSFKDSLSELEALKTKALSVQQEINSAKQDSLAMSESLAAKDAETATKYAQQGASAQIDAITSVSSSSSKSSKTVLEHWASTFKSLSSSAKDFKNIASDIFGSLSGGEGFIATPDSSSGTGSLAAKVIKSLFKGLLGGAFADGGRPDTGRVSLVGEQGPELFVPDTAGTVVPNDALKGGSGPIVYQNFTFQSLDPVTNMKLLQSQKSQIQAWVADGIKNNQNGLRSTIKSV
jgi:hypothetical protein